MSASRRHVGAVVTAWTMSLAAHLALLGAIGPTLVGRLGNRGRAEPVRVLALALPADPTVPVELLAPVPPGAAIKMRTRPSDSPGGDRVPRPDTGRAGRGGRDTVTEPAVNLAARDDLVHRVPAVQSRVDRAQQARRRSSDRRSSPEDDLVTDRPMELTFVADGRGPRHEQRPVALDDPSGGFWRDRVAARAGTGPAERARDVDPGERRAAPTAGEHDGTRRGQDSEVTGAYSSPGQGVADGPAGPDDRASAPVASGRPDAPRGDDSTPADTRGPERDDVDAEQEAMTPERALLNASTAGGRPGVGSGGEAGPGPAGAGGTIGAGSRARAQGDGPGRGSGVDPTDPRRSSYLRAVGQRIHQRWSADDFPKWAALSGRQGYAIVSFTIASDGAVSDVALVRGSGVPEFDARMCAAVWRAGPFGPLPAHLAPTLRHRHEFVISNPAVW